MYSGAGLAERASVVVDHGSHATRIWRAQRATGMCPTAVPSPGHDTRSIGHGGDAGELARHASTRGLPRSRR